MSNLSNKQMRNSRGFNSYNNPAEEETRWGLRHAGSWPSDWSPRRTCELCKKEFRTDTDEGFSNWFTDVCADCIRKLVKKEKIKKNTEEVPFERRIDQIKTQ